MKVKLVKIKRHWWCPLITKEVILSITPDIPIKGKFKISGSTKNNERVEFRVETKEESYIQPMCNNWEIEIKKEKVSNIN